MGSLCDSVKLRSYYRSRDLSNVTKIAVATAARTSRQPPPGREESQAREIPIKTTFLGQPNPRRGEDFVPHGEEE